MSTLTEDDVRSLIAEHLTERNRIDPESVQWLVRSAYEEGWRDGGGDPAISEHDAPAIGWRAAWISSKARSLLVRQGFITGGDSWK